MRRPGTGQKKKRWEKPPAVSSAVRSCLEEDCRQEILRRAAREKEISDEGLYAVIDQVLAEEA